MRELPVNPAASEIQPWHSLGGVEHICELHKSCTVLYGIFVELARMVYLTTDGRLKGTPDVVWKPGGTELWIDSELRWEDEHPEVRPAIYVGLGQMQRQPVCPLGNGRVTGLNRFGEQIYEMDVSGTVNFIHIAQTVGEACALADNTEYALSAFQGAICNDFCFTTFASSGRVALQKAQKESGDRFVSTATFSFTFPDAFLVKEECPILKAVDFVGDEHISASSSRQATVKHDNISAEHTVPAQNR